MPARITAFLVWAAAAACAVFWGLRLFVSPHGVPVQTQPVSVAHAQRGDILRLFASAATPALAVQAEPALAARFKLIGVMAPKSTARGREQGIALIAVDDKPPRAYRVGARLDNTLVLQSVATRSAIIGPVNGAVALQLDLPLPVPPATGQLPQIDGFLPNPPMAPAAPPAAGSPNPPQPARTPSAAPLPAPSIPEDDPSNRR
jgi:general secretion pathway protein C